jgi:hypothetical protein
MFIMLVIVASSVALASEDPVDEQSPINLFLAKVDIVFTSIFTFEMLLKVKNRIRKLICSNLIIIFFNI